MSKVKNKGRDKADVLDLQPQEKVRISSVLFGLSILMALIVAAAAWMGGSMSQIERRVGHVFDGAARSMGLAVEYVSVEGVGPELADKVRFAALVQPGENMFRADPYLIRKRIEDTHLVMNVQVHRFWPDHILILADAVQPIALWQQGTDWQMVDSLGRVIPEPENVAKADSLVRLAGTGADAAAPHLIAALNEFPQLAERVTLATRIASERWDAEFDTGILVRLPKDTVLAPAIRRLAFMERDNDILARPIEAIDLRHTDQVFLTPRTADNTDIDQADTDAG